MSGVDLGPGWSPLDFMADEDMGVARVSQGDQDVIVPKSHIRKFIEKLESLEKQLLRG